MSPITRTFLIRWSIRNAYGDPEGRLLVEASYALDAIARAEREVREKAQIRHGDFHAEATDVTYLRSYIAQAQELSGEDRRLLWWCLDALI